MVEILFARGLVKVLFATETFAMVSKARVLFLAKYSLGEKLGCEYASENSRVLWYS
jgi:hypothetical protein